MRRLFSWLLIFTFLLCGCSDSSDNEDAAKKPDPTVYEVGVQSLCIDPREGDGIELAGFSNPNRRFDGVLDSIEVTCAVFVQNDVTFIMVSADILGWNTKVMADLRNRVETLLGIPGENILFNASHTHSGPATQDSTIAVGDYSESYNEFLAAQTFDCIVSAAFQREKCTLYQGTADADDLAVNRRKEIDGVINFMPDLDKECCRESDFLIAKKGEDIKLILFSFGAHPSILTGNYLSADYVGAARRVLETKYVGATAMFIQGCGGDAKPKVLNDYGTNFKANNYSDVQIIGNRLAQNIISDIRKEEFEPVVGDLMFKQVEFSLALELEEYTREDYLRMAEEQKDSYLYDVHMWYYNNYDNLPTSVPYMLQRIDFGSGMSVIAMSGEVVWGYDKLISDLMPDRNVLVAGYSNGVPGYICTTVMYDEGGYEPYGSTAINQLSHGYHRDTEKIILSYAKALCSQTAEDSAS